MARELVDKYNAAFVAALRSSEAKSKFASLLAEPVWSSPDEFGRFMRAELAKYEKVVKLSGAKVD
jgi:tripartite-type tricarboxylate transporter receptor subunit TctC